MKNLIFKIAILWLLCALLLGWVWLVSHAMDWRVIPQTMLIGFVIAPISEEIFYRYIPVTLERKFPRLGWIPGIFFNFMFINIHIGNYAEDGVYWAFCFQGVMGFISLYLCRKYGLWASILFHAKYNIGIYFLNL